MMDRRGVVSKSLDGPYDEFTSGNLTSFEGSAGGDTPPPPAASKMYHTSGELKRVDEFVSKAKSLVAVVLFLAVAVVATITFRVVSGQEHEVFENQVCLLNL